MAVVAGVDFGTLSVRVTLVDSQMGPVGTASASYPLHRRREDPDFATQSHADQMAALAVAMKDVLAATGISGGSVEALALDTTGSSVIPVGEGLEPLDEYYLWCDHRAHAEAEEITTQGARDGTRGDRVVRRRVLARVGICEAAALAAAQSGQAGLVCDGAGALRHGGGHAVRREERTRTETQRVRDGPQVDVESQVGRVAAGGISGCGGSAAWRVCARRWAASI